MNFVPFDQTMFTEENRRALAMLILLFERKNALVEDLRSLNDSYEENQIFTDNFRQKYAWSAIQLQATNSIIEPVLTKFRYRMIKPEFLERRQEESKINIEDLMDVDDADHPLIINSTKLCKYNG